MVCFSFASGFEMILILSHDPGEQEAQGPKGSQRLWKVWKVGEHRCNAVCPMISRETSQLYVAPRTIFTICRDQMKSAIDRSWTCIYHILSLSLYIYILYTYTIYIILYIYHISAAMAYGLLRPMSQSPAPRPVIPCRSRCLPRHAMLQRRELHGLRSLLHLQLALPLQRGRLGLAPLPQASGHRDIEGTKGCHGNGWKRWWCGYDMIWHGSESFHFFLMWLRFTFAELELMMESWNWMRL